MTQTIELGDITVDVFKKDIKNLHLSVYPPTGRVRISAPTRMSLDTIRLFAISKIGWIKKERQKRQDQERETPREYIDRESHYLWGQRFLLRVAEHDAPPTVELHHRAILLLVRPHAPPEKREAILADWYRNHLRLAAPDIIAKWEQLMRVRVEKIYVQQMKTRWGSCNHKTATIRLNPELAKKPRECMEYVIVHEMCHLLEPTHNDRFTALLDKYMPEWRQRRDMLNRLPLRHEKWGA